MSERKVEVARLAFAKRRRQLRRESSISVAVSQFARCVAASWATFCRTPTGSQWWQHVLPSLHKTDMPPFLQQCCCPTCRKATRTPMAVIVVSSDANLAITVAQKLQSRRAPFGVKFACPIVVDTAPSSRENSAEAAMESWLLQCCLGAPSHLLGALRPFPRVAMAVVAVGYAHHGGRLVNAIAAPTSASWFSRASGRGSPTVPARQALTEILECTSSCLLTQHHWPNRRNEAAIFHRDATVHTDVYYERDLLLKVLDLQGKQPQHLVHPDWRCSICHEPASTSQVLAHPRCGADQHWCCLACISSWHAVALKATCPLCNQTCSPLMKGSSATLRTVAWLQSTPLHDYLVCRQPPLAISQLLVQLAAP